MSDVPPFVTVNDTETAQKSYSELLIVGFIVWVVFGSWSNPARFVKVGIYTKCMQGSFSVYVN